MTQSKRSLITQAQFRKKVASFSLNDLRLDIAINPRLGNTDLGILSTDLREIVIHAVVEYQSQVSGVSYSYV